MVHILLLYGLVVCSFNTNTHAPHFVLLLFGMTRTAEHTLSWYSPLANNTPTPTTMRAFYWFLPCMLSGNNTLYCPIPLVFIFSGLFPSFSTSLPSHSVGLRNIMPCTPSFYSSIFISLLVQEIVIVVVIVVITAGGSRFSNSIDAP